MQLTQVYTDRINIYARRIYIPDNDMACRSLTIKCHRSLPQAKFAVKYLDKTNLGAASLIRIE